MISQAVAGMMLSAATQEEQIIQDALQIRFHYQARVTVRKPSWMPEWVYQRLMRTIVIEVTEGRIGDQR